MGLALLPITIRLCIEHFDDHLSSKNNGLFSLSDYNEDVNLVYLYIIIIHGNYILKMMFPSTTAVMWFNCHY